MSLDEIEVRVWLHGPPGEQRGEVIWAAERPWLLRKRGAGPLTVVYGEAPEGFVTKIAAKPLQPDQTYLVSMTGRVDYTIFSSKVFELRKTSDGSLKPVYWRD